MTSQEHRSRLKRSALAAGAALTVVVTGAGAVPGSGAAAAERAAGQPSLKLIAASSSVTIDRWEDAGVFLDLGTYVTVDDAPLEFKVTRKSYKDPVVAQQILRDGTRTKTKKLPAGLVKDFSGLPGFLEVSISNAAGEEVKKVSETFCPNNASGRLRPDAPATSHYPEGCSTNPWTLGSVWGVEKGWAANSARVDWENPVDLPEGEYTLDERSIRIQEGAVRLSDGTLAGSVLTMERALQNICSATGLSLAEAWVMSSLNAARAIGVSSHKGSLEVGKDADLVLLDESFHVNSTIVMGETIFSNSENFTIA